MMKRQIADTYNQAKELQYKGNGEYGGEVDLTIEDIISLLQGKFIVFNSEEYDGIIRLNPINYTEFHLDTW